MKTTLIVSLAVGAMIFAADRASANTSGSVLSKLNISGDIHYQVDDTYKTNSDESITTITKYKKVTFKANDLIEALNNSPAFIEAISYATEGSSTNIPKGSYLVVNNDTSHVLVTNKNGFSFDLSESWWIPSWESYHSFAGYSRDEIVCTGNENTVTGQENFTILGGNGMFWFDDGAGTDLSFKGFIKTEWSASKVDGDGNRKIGNSVTSDGSGNGHFEGAEAVIRGRSSADGSGKEPWAI